MDRMPRPALTSNSQIPGFQPDEQPIERSADGKSLYYYRPGPLPAEITRIDLASGRCTCRCRRCEPDWADCDDSGCAIVHLWPPSHFVASLSGVRITLGFPAGHGLCDGDADRLAARLCHSACVFAIAPEDEQRQATNFCPDGYRRSRQPSAKHVFDLIAASVPFVGLRVGYSMIFAFV